MPSKNSRQSKGTKRSHGVHEITLLVIYYNQIKGGINWSI